MSHNRRRRRASARRRHSHPSIGAGQRGRPVGGQGERGAPGSHLHRHPCLSRLSPSAGQGAMIDAILKVRPRVRIWVVELMDVNRVILYKKYKDAIYMIKGTNDFLETKPTPSYDVIIANPPFTKNQDIDHLRHMYNQLKPGGQMVCMTSKHWEQSSNKKETEFREWLMDLDNCGVLDVKANAFKSSGTSIETNIVVIWK